MRVFDYRLYESGVDISIRSKCSFPTQVVFVFLLEVTGRGIDITESLQSIGHVSSCCVIGCSTRVGFGLTFYRTPIMLPSHLYIGVRLTAH